MIYCATVMSVGLTIFLYGVMNSLEWLIFIGLILYFIGMVCGEAVEGKQNAKIAKLEKDIRELKENGKH